MNHPDSPSRCIFVATHHKSGTVWMMTTFIRIAKKNGWDFIHLNEGESGWSLRPDKQQVFDNHIAQLNHDQVAIFNDYHSDIPDLTRAKQSRRFRGVHIIRDPRDMLYSAVQFHLKANEPWLDEPDPGTGTTFRQRLRACPDLRSQIELEMDTHMGWTIEQMANLDDQGVFINVPYEDLITDTDMRQFHRVLVHLGLAGPELINALDAYWASSLFGERSDLDIEATRSHINKSVPEQWRTELPADCIDLIEERYGWAIEKLGYPCSKAAEAPGS